jgi:mitochondrial import inner membrane translocase subunit TIM16
MRTRRVDRHSPTIDRSRARAGGPSTTMASRILANLLVAGGSALVRAASQAYRQAIVNAQRTGVAREAANGAANGGGAGGVFGKKVMTLEEARAVLGVDASATYAEVYARYEKLFESNAKQGTFYLQSKVFRAKESLDAEYGVETAEAHAEAEAERAAGTQKSVGDGDASSTK